MTKEEFLKSGLIEQHVLGLTSPEEEQVVQQFLQLHPELQLEVDALHHAMQQYASQYAIPAVPGESSEKQHPRPVAVKRAGISGYLLYGLLLLLGLASAFLWRQNQQQQSSILHLEAEYAALATYCEQHEQKARAAQAMLEKTKLPTTSKYVLAGTTLAPDCFAVAYWNPDLKEGWLDPTKLPALPKDKQYQIWADVHGEMISIGLIPKDNDALVAINFLPEAESINITQEVSGGTDHPTVKLLTVSGLL